METTVAEHPNVTLFRKGYDAFNSGDLETLRSQFAGDIVWHASGTSRFAGDLHGIDDTLASFGELAQQTNGTLRLEVHDILANDTHGVALVTSHWEFEGEPYQDRNVHVVHIKDGKVTESWFFDWSDTFDKQFPA